MTGFRLFALFVLSVLTLTLPMCKEGKQKPSKEVQRRVQSMSVEEKVGQLFMIGFNGRDISPRLREWIVDRHAGGVIIFRKNVNSEKQLISLTSEMQSLAQGSKPGLPLLIATDQELGVSRTEIKFGGVPPEPREVARMDSSDVVSLATEIARDLRSWGINMTMAPVVDIDQPQGDTPLSYRTFSSNPDTVAYLARIFISSFQKERVIAAAKHFPGLGDVTIDSHKDMPRTDKTIDELLERELRPYQGVIAEDVACIMSAHILVRSVDSSNPATLSKTVLTGLLRERLGFQGVIITDDMQMGGISKHYDLPEACVMSINAGADIILHCQFLKGLATAEECYECVLKAAYSGEIPRKRLDEAVYRILILKEDL
ncbi:hypothetical protein CEE36_08675 [candidate division TA06 bacterium B3_TA06]|uniref:beta-N-acetylhexosaminidase n=1 Tax=candidate division TA06 bacterium B3_TA06 TaxID=2012487 RepID=A0A532V159_UNCT6|nr:MAG: hypothetical protein CEE36_08675 [candidate division TA06 bacterium B3_TA06]